MQKQREQCLKIFVIGIVICVYDLISSKSKKRFQKKARPKKSHYSSERPRAGISKPNYVKGIPLLLKNLKLNYPRNQLIPYKCIILWKTQPKIFQICADWTTRQKAVFKPNYV